MKSRNNPNHSCFGSLLPKHVVKRRLDKLREYVTNAQSCFGSSTAEAGDGDMPCKHRQQATEATAGYLRGSMFRISISALILIMCCAIVIYAQQADVKKLESPKYTEVKYSADNLSYKWEGQDKILVLTGNVKFIQGDTVLAADKVDYRESSRTASASGNLRIYDTQNTITSNLATVYFKDKKGSLTGNVVMTVKPKPSVSPQPEKKTLQSEIKDEATITCDALDYFYKDKRAVVPKAVKITQKTRVVTADSALYIGSDEIVELNGNVKGSDDKEKYNFTSPKVRVSLKDTDQWIEAEKASGSFYVKDEETQPASEPAITPASTPGK
ncbi:MAG: LptA/OstA family protein [Armatimonadota bacterium]